MGREKVEAWSKDNGFNFCDTAGGKPVKDKTKHYMVSNFRIEGK